MSKKVKTNYQNFDERQNLMANTYDFLNEKQKLYINSLAAFLNAERTAHILNVGWKIKQNKHRYNRKNQTLKINRVQAQIKADVLAHHLDNLRDGLTPLQRHDERLVRLENRLLERNPMDLRMISEIIEEKY